MCKEHVEVMLYFIIILCVVDTQKKLNTGTFLAIGKRTKVALGDDGCPIE